MCYETSNTKNREQVENYSKAVVSEVLGYKPNYHVSGFSKYTNQYIIPMENKGLIFPTVWGLIPEFALNDPDTFSKKYNTLNAKRETLFSSIVYRESAKNKRCLILADGFFEPHKEGKVSIPYYCYIPTKEYEDGRDMFCFAGIYSEIGIDLYSCSIITTEANDFFSEIHNVKKRMPLVLDEGLKDEWLNDGLKQNQVEEIMQNGFTSKEFNAYPVSRDLYKRDIDTNNPKILNPVDNNSLF
jgi:putative SOS response-associated peptidase YedK|tara:strand:+ start:60036 stop:60761 length:726 start_codon:yes stop_codon:yes gene_type:complete